MSKRKDDSSDARGSMDVDQEGAAASSHYHEDDNVRKQGRSYTWYCDYCKKEIDDTKDYWVPWWENWYLKISCMECSDKYEAKEKEAKEKETNASMDCE